MLALGGLVRPALRSALLVLVLCGVAFAPPASAQLGPISGRLTAPGYTVMAFAATGQVRSVVARDGSFALLPPAATVTLHLRAPDGTYAGPVVVEDDLDRVARARQAVTRAKRQVRRRVAAVNAARRKLRAASGDRAARSRASRTLRRARRRAAKARRRLRVARRALRLALQLEAERSNRAIVGIRAGATLGDVAVDRAAGYALVRGLRGPRAIAAVDTGRTAQARSGVPIGAGSFGLVRSARTDGAAGGDRDLDGIPEPLDIDDDGDLVLDNQDRSLGGRAARAAQVTGCGPGNIYCAAVISGLVLFLKESVNANAGSTDAEIDAALASRGHLGFGRPTSGPVELDCAGDLAASPPRPGLRYCSTGGPGVASVGVVPGAPPFPGPLGGAFDPDRDGFGVLDPALGIAGENDFFLGHAAVARRDGLDPAVVQIGSGDQFLLHKAADGDSARCPPPPGEVNAACVSSAATLQYVFATAPALVRYSDTAGHAATLTYPTASFDPNCGPSCDAPGTEGNGLVASPGPDGNVWLRLTFWRPQRRAIPGSADPPGATWMDVGHLTYRAAVSQGNRFCRQSAFSEDDPSTPVVEDDPNLVLGSPHPFEDQGGFDDLRDDEPSSPGDASPERTVTYSLNLTRCLADLGLTLSDNLMLSFLGAPAVPGAFTQQVVTFRPPSGAVVRTVTDPAESTTTGTEFEFRPLGRPNFKLRHEGTQSFDIAPGEYQVEELDAPGYELTSVACSDSDSTGDTALRRATFKISAGEHVTCTFTNKKL